MKEWQCVLVSNHKDVGKTIEEHEKEGWWLHSYACAGNAALALGTNHFTCSSKRKATSRDTKFNGKDVR